MVFTAGDSADGTVYFDDAVAAVPEPSSLMLLVTGTLGVFGISNKKSKKMGHSE